MAKPNQTLAREALSIDDFCHTYNVGRTRAYEEINSGRLKTYRVGRLRRISRRAGDEWQRQREQEAA